MKILFIGLNWMGDVIMSFPALACAAAQGAHEVDVLTRPQWRELYRLHPGVRNIWTIPTREFWGRHLTAYLRVRKTGYDRIFVLPRSFRSAFIAFLCGGTRRVGYPGDHREWLLHDVPPLPPDFEKRHEQHLHLGLIETLGFPSTGTHWRPNAPTPQEIATTFTKYNLDNQEQYIIMAPGAAFGEAKRWPPQRFARLARRLTEETRFKIILTGSNSESHLTAMIAGELGSRGVDLGGKTTIRELTCLLSGAQAVIANDSGTMHLGAILGRPVVVPVGSTDMKRTGPLTEKAYFVQGQSCNPPCRQRTCSRGDRRCMESIELEPMLAATLKALRHG